MRSRLIRSLGLYNTSLVFSTAISRPLYSFRCAATTASVKERSTHVATSPLAVLPLSNVVRSFLITTVSSSPFLLGVATNLLRSAANSKRLLMNVERNLLLKWLLKHTFYAQFCAGENKREVRKTLNNLRRVGYHGIILEYASEALEDTNGNGRSGVQAPDEAVERWREDMLATVDMMDVGDFVGLKWSGMGARALQLLKQNQPPSAQMAQAMKDVCDAAARRDVLLLPAAEPQNANAAVDEWNLDLSQKYNKTAPGHALIYNTYQCYLKSTPTNLSKHLAHAQVHGYTLGVKLVRGAYLGSEERHLIWPSIEDTHNTYDAIMENLLHRRFGTVLQGSGEFPSVNVVLATHNRASVRKARMIRDVQIQDSQQPVKLVYAQLQGMADEVSCELLQWQQKSAMNQPCAETPIVHKCLVRGTTSQCLNYLLRRAAENKEAMSRTLDTRRAMAQELRRRMRAVISLA